MENWIINETSQRIEYLDSRFYLHKGTGVLKPSVTTILDATYPKSAGFHEWLKRVGGDADEIRDEAGRRGSVVHNLTESLDRGNEVVLASLDEGPKFKLVEAAMFERYVEFRQRHPAKIEEIEMHLIDKDLEFAGTLDRVMMINGDRWIIDIKTSNAVYDQYELQLIAYWQLYCKIKKIPEHEALKIRLGVLHLNASTRTYGKGDAIQGPGWQLVETWNSKEFLIDLWAAQQVMWNAIKATVKPKHLSYKLSHKLETVEQPQTIEP